MNLDSYLLTFTNFFASIFRKHVTITSLDQLGQSKVSANILANFLGFCWIAQGLIELPDMGDSRLNKPGTEENGTCHVTSGPNNGMYATPTRNCLI